jgi:phenylpyruvate tautomerase PptA (4-oxalocrotonate tautomerase family)
MACQCTAKQYIVIKTALYDLHLVSKTSKSKRQCVITRVSSVTHTLNNINDRQIVVVFNIMATGYVRTLFLPWKHREISLKISI